MAEKCTKTSGPSPSCSMKPKPFSALNHLTVPCAMPYSFCDERRGRVITASGCRGIRLTSRLVHGAPGRVRRRLQEHKAPAVLLRVPWDQQRVQLQPRPTLRDALGVVNPGYPS